MKFLKRFFISTLFLFSFALQADEALVWSVYKDSVRYFFSIEQEGSVFKLNHYRQEKGEYQERVSVQTFSTQADAFRYINLNYTNYTQTKKLAPWSNHWITIDEAKDFSDKKNKRVWEARNEWSQEWEQRYAKWLASEVDSDFYQKHSIPVDCADAAIGFRWIFARINSLPAGNILSSTGDVFGHFSMLKSWQDLPSANEWYNDRLFLAALNYVMDMTSTVTVLNGDTYPVKLDRVGLLAGTFILTRNNGSGHIRTITQNYYDHPTELPLVTFSSTAPREVRSLYRENFVDQKWPERKIKEVVAFRWPVVSGSKWILKKRESHASFSEEQFSKELESSQYSLIQFIISRVNQSYDPLKLPDIGVADIKLGLEHRVGIVQQGYQYCKTHDCRPGTQAYEDWSTPNRDEKLVKKYSDMESLITDFNSTYPGLLDKWNHALGSSEMLIEGRTMNLSEIRSLFTRGLTTSNPWETPARRWGLQSLFFEGGL